MGKIVEPCLNLFYLGKESVKGVTCYSNKQVKVENFSTFLIKALRTRTKKENDPK